VLGVAYKADISDTRESPAIKLIELLRRAGADVSYHDRFVPDLPEAGLSSVELDPEGHDCVVVVTAHTHIDYDDVVDRSHVVVDLRNATGRNGSESEKVWKL
jgi:UDP-N-acetyl-D-glucosamine dehydrogenase